MAESPMVGAVDDAIRVLTQKTFCVSFFIVFGGRGGGVGGWGGGDGSRGGSRRGGGRRGWREGKGGGGAHVRVIKAVEAFGQCCVVCVTYTKDGRLAQTKVTAVSTHAQRGAREVAPL